MRSRSGAAVARRWQRIYLVWVDFLVELQPREHKPSKQSQENTRRPCSRTYLGSGRRNRAEESGGGIGRRLLRFGCVPASAQIPCGDSAAVYRAKGCACSRGPNANDALLSLKLLRLEGTPTPRPATPQRRRCKWDSARRRNIMMVQERAAGLGAGEGKSYVDTANCHAGERKSHLQHHAVCGITKAHTFCSPAAALSFCLRRTRKHARVAAAVTQRSRMPWSTQQHLAATQRCNTAPR